MLTLTIPVRASLWLVALLASGTVFQAAPAYRFEWLTPGLPSSVPYDINDAGLIVGACGPGWRACLIDGTIVQDIRPPGSGGSDSRARAVNEAGHVVIESGFMPSQAWFWDGTSYVRIHASGTGMDLNETDSVVGEDNSGRPWGWTPSGGLVDLAPLVGRPFARPTALNDSGHFAGIAADASGSGNMIFYHDGLTLHEISFGPASVGAGSYTSRMNSVGQFVGGVEATGLRHALVYDVVTDTARDVHPVSGPLAAYDASEAHDINDVGQIVGSIFPASFDTVRAMLLKGDEATDLQEFMPSDVIASEATAINNSGVIVGITDTSMFGLQGFRLTPIDLDASVRITPRTLNVGVLIGDLSARVRVAADLRDSVDLDSIELRSVGGVRVPGGGIRPVSITQPGRGVIQTQFNRRDLRPALDAVRSQLGTDVAFTFAGRLNDGATFIVSDAVRVVGLEIPIHSTHVRRPHP